MRASSWGARTAAACSTYSVMVRKEAYSACTECLFCSDALGLRRTPCADALVAHILPHVAGHARRARCRTLVENFDVDFVLDILAHVYLPHHVAYDRRKKM